MTQLTYKFPNKYELQVKVGPNLWADFFLVSSTGDTELYGYVKWDGCMNWSTSNSCMYHFCDPEDAEFLTTVFKKAWELGKQAMGTDTIDIHYPDITE